MCTSDESAASPGGGVSEITARSDRPSNSHRAPHAKAPASYVASVRNACSPRAPLVVPLVRNTATSSLAECAATRANRNTSVGTAGIPAASSTAASVSPRAPASLRTAGTCRI